MAAPSPLRAAATRATGLALVAFVFYTSAVGPFESLIHRALFLGLVVCLGLLTYPLGAGRRWRPLGAALDAAMALVALWACGTVIARYEEIMTTLPMATAGDIFLTAALVAVILEIARRAIGWIFPALVLAMLAYALFGNLVPGRLGHRGFDVYFVTENLFLGDLGIWGLLMGVAATIIAVFTLFGSVLLHTGGGQTFIDLAMRLGGNAPGGGAKIATIASGIFGMVSGSAVANVATTGNFTIPLMKRLNYPPALAAATEAVASTGGQIAPPIMGAAAFLMAEIVGVDYLKVMGAAALPAFLFYLGVFMTIHVMAREKNLGFLPDAELPTWRQILYWRRTLPVGLALGGLIVGIARGNSIQTAAFYGTAAALAAFPLVRIRGRADLRPALGQALGAVDDASKGLLVIGILLAGAQILVSMTNLTGLGITLSSLIVSLGGDSVMLVALIVAAVCMVLGMGIPTTAAYVLVAAVLAPAMMKVQVAPIVAHMFVFYYATISVITPPVCIAVFVAAGIAQAPWGAVAKKALALGAVTYVIPFLFLLYPGMLAQGTWADIAEAAYSGVVFVVAFSAVFGGMRVFRRRAWNVLAWLAVAGLAIYPSLWVSAAAGVLGLALYRARAGGARAEAAVA